MRPAALLVLSLIPAVALAMKDPPVDDAHWSKKYDGMFRKYAKHYFGPHVDWKWFKAQAIAESNLKPAARSPTGAVGIMQILPSTFREIKKQNPYVLDIRTPRWNIAAGIYYDRKMYLNWRNKGLTTDERLAYAFGSYNAGFGGLRKAYRKASSVNATVSTWEEVAPYAPRETRKYVKRIRGLMRKSG
ncbi:MAG: transglycosylase SLT domain-containing protein [Gammaproteobacteria bacterium]|jgi:soluble lytic murein transglycosylase-like protein